MEIYLPIAEMSVHWLLLFGMGGAVGFLSGMFGVGGGFLLTPLLIFYGIPSGVAVATTASHVTASSMSGALTQWRNRAIDVKLAAVMTASGVVGTVVGVWLFGILREAGQMELIVSASYVILLGTIGSLMLRESLETLAAARRGERGPSAKAQHHSWIHGLPFKMRFREFAALHQRDTAGADRVHGWLAVGDHGHRRRVCSGAGADLSGAGARQHGDGHIAACRSCS